MTKRKTPLIDMTVLESASECLRALSHPIRLRMVEMLLNGRYTVGELAEACDVRPNVASEHLRFMELSGLLDKERDGRKIFYQSAHPGLVRILDCIRHQF